VTLTLVDAASPITIGATANRYNIGLAPTLNLACFWKYVLLLLRQEQRALNESGGGTGGGSVSANGSTGVLHNLNHLTHTPGTQLQLAELDLDGELESMHPSRLRLKYTDEHGFVRPLFHSADFTLALRLLAELKKIDLVVRDWNGRVSSQAPSQLRGDRSTPSPSLKHMSLLRPLEPKHRGDSPAVTSSTASDTTTTPDLTLLRVNSTCTDTTNDSPESLPESPSTSQDEDSSNTSTSPSPHPHPPRLTARVPTALSVVVPTPRSAALSQRRASIPCKFFSADPAKNACTRVRCPFLHAADAEDAKPREEAKSANPVSGSSRGSVSVSSESASPDVQWLVVPGSGRSKSSPMLRRQSSAGQWRPARAPTPYHFPVSPSRWRPLRCNTPRRTKSVNDEQEDESEERSDEEEEKHADAIEEEESDGSDEEAIARTVIQRSYSISQLLSYKVSDTNALLSSLLRGLGIDLTSAESVKFSGLCHSPSKIPPRAFPSLEPSSCFAYDLFGRAAAGEREEKRQGTEGERDEKTGHASSLGVIDPTPCIVYLTNCFSFGFPHIDLTQVY
jgi:hypothetical protein